VLAPNNGAIRSGDFAATLLPCLYHSSSYSPSNTKPVYIGQELRLAICCIGLRSSKLSEMVSYMSPRVCRRDQQPTSICRSPFAACRFVLCAETRKRAFLLALSPRF
jgi:hypothetical protein